VTPPYDVISKAKQAGLYDNHPHNIIRLELNRPEPGDDEDNNRYTRAAGFLRQWTAAGVLKAEDRFSLYINETTYSDAGGQTLTRRGFFTRLRLEEFSRGIVLPHERTFSGHKADRLQLIKAAKTNISPIMALYPDPDNQVQAALYAGNPRLLAEFDDPAGCHQRLLAVDDLAAIAEVQALMAEKTVFIADGHHRYETGLTYRQYLREQDPARFSASAPCNYILTYLCSMSDPGLSVFASHRVLPKWENFSLPGLLTRLQPFFSIKEYPLNGSREQDSAHLREQLKLSGKISPTFGFMSKNEARFWILTLKEQALERAVMEENEPELRNLDVVILSELVLTQGLGLKPQDYDQVNLIEYISGLSNALNSVADGLADLAFFLNPTKVEQVRAAAEKGFIMPHKSTYFYPKVLTGLVLNPVG
jgi:uncharacterized protein (DUF1015 family)